MADVLDIENQDEFEEFGVDEDGDRKSTLFFTVLIVMDVFSSFLRWKYAWLVVNIEVFNICYIRFMKRIVNAIHNLNFVRYRLGLANLVGWI